ncbi:MAG: NPXTG-anchored protein [Ruminococcus sp.]|nr:NPXTG-anchored protein [Ruminococcus sp.]
MNMKKIFAAMAATAVSASAFAAMTLTNANAADTVAIAGIRGQAGTYTYWGESDNTGNVTVKDATVDGNAQYEATWEITGDGTGSIEFLILDIKKPAELENEFTKDTYPDLNVVVDEIYIDGQEFAFTQDTAAYNLAYYESAGKNGTRVYLTDTWTGASTLGVAKDQPITASVKVVFTVSGLYNDGTSNVTEEEPTTEAPTTTEAPATTTAAGETTTTGATTTTKAGATTTKAANGGKTETSTNTGVAGVGVAASALALAGVAAFVARKKD